METNEYFKQDKNFDLNQRVQELELQVIDLQKEINRLKNKNLSLNKFNEEHVNYLVKQLENHKFNEK
jgi:hypothetical protein